MKRRNSLAAAVAALAALVIVPLASSTAVAQPNDRNQGDPNELNAPQPSAPNKAQSTITGTLVAMALAGLVVGVNCIPSKRGHQD
ncbi:MAG: hypothetical protein AB7G11_02860 [Phycisphaerales bacterium]